MHSNEYPEIFMLAPTPGNAKAFAGSRCPATFALGNAISLYLEYTGRGYGAEDYNGWRCDIAYSLVEMLTGYACRPGCTSQTPADTRFALEAMGFEYQEYCASPAHGDCLCYKDMKDAIMHALVIDQRPVIVKNAVEFGGIIVGYESAGDVLIGWHYPAFNFAKALAPQTVRCERWYRNETELLLLDAPEVMPGAEALYLAGLQRVKGYIEREEPLTLAGFDEWICFLRMDQAEAIQAVRRSLCVPGSWDVFTFDNLEDGAIRRALNHMADPLWCDYAERRYYMANFLRQAAAFVPEQAEGLKAAAAMYWPIDAAMHAYDEKCGHRHEDDSVDEAVFWDADNRAALIALVESCRAQEERIVVQLLAALR